MLPLRPSPGPGACTQVSLFTQWPEGGSLLRGIHKLICSSRGPSLALNLIAESSSGTRKGSRVTPSQKKRPPNKLSSASPPKWHKTQTPCLDEARSQGLPIGLPVPPASPSGPQYMADALCLAGSVNAGAGCGHSPGTGRGKRAHWPGEAMSCLLYTSDAADDANVV